MHAQVHVSSRTSIPNVPLGNAGTSCASCFSATSGIAVFDSQRIGNAPLQSPLLTGKVKQAWSQLLVNVLHLDEDSNNDPCVSCQIEGWIWHRFKVLQTICFNICTSLYLDLMSSSRRPLVCRASQA
jgi:hypothetical protein